MNFKALTAGFFCTLVGGAGLDAEGKAYTIAWIILIIGMSIMAYNLIQNYVTERRRDELDV